VDERQIRQTLRDFIARFFRGHAFQDGDDLFALGYVNSMFALQLVQFVEGSFGVAVGADDLELDNFRSIDALCALVLRKQAAR
jgi:acyl carrier protein